MSGGEMGHDTDTGTVTCPACDATNAIGARFCERCGTRLPQRANREVAFEHSSPGPSDATVTFERPSREPLTGEPGSQGSSSDTPAAGNAVEPAPSAAIIFRPEGSASAPPSPRPSDAATIAFPLPPAVTANQETARTVPGAESGDTEALPGELSATSTSEPPVLAAAEAPPPASQPPAAGATTSRGFETWTPEVRRDTPPASASPNPATQEAQVAPVPAPAAPRDEPSAGATMPTMIPPAAAPFENVPTAGAVTGQPAVPGRFVPPAPGAPPGTVRPVAPQTGASPTGAASYPVPQSPGTGAPSVGPYPAPAVPATGSGNRTLWIVLGVVGALVLLCVLACVGIFVISAVSASATTAAVATGVATVTRP